MKQIFQNFKTGKLELVDIPIPSVKPGFVLVKNHYSLISAGTEKAVIKLAQESMIGKAKSRPDQVKQVLGKIKTDGIITTFQRVMKKLDKPLPLGYSSSGEVIEVGEDVKEFSVGDRVACAGGGYASHAEIITVPKNLCIKIPDNVSYKQASFTTLGSVAMQGVRRANLTQGEKVAVIGLGLLGQLTCQILKAYGFSVIGIDIDETKIKDSSEQGLLNIGASPNEAEQLTKTFTNNNGVDSVIITAATKTNQPIELAGKVSKKKGTISVVGDVKMDIPRKVYYTKELDLKISCSYGPGRYDEGYEEKGYDYPFEYVRWTEKRNMEEFVRLINKNLINPDKLITHIFDIEEAEKTYDFILNNPKKEKINGILFSYDTKKEHKNIISFEGNTKYESKDKVNVGLIGVGNFAQGIILPALKKIKNANLIAAADTNGINAQRIIKQFHGQYATTDWHKIVEDKNIDLVIVATRHNLHATIVIEALKRNKNVHVEKPLCLNNDELKEIIKVAKNSTGRLMVGFNRRFAPSTIKAKKIFKNNAPLIISCTINAGFIPKNHWVHDSKEGGGRIIGEACHFVDLCHYLAGSEPTTVFASLVPLQKGVQTEDNIAITLDFKNGSHGTIIYTSLAPKTLPKERIEIFGGDKAMVIDNFKSDVIYTSSGKKKTHSYGQNKGHNNEFKSFIRAIKEGKPCPIPLQEIILSTQATFDSLESAKKKQIINVSPEI